MELGKLTTGCKIDLKGNRIVVSSDKYNNDTNYQTTINNALKTIKNK